MYYVYKKNGFEDKKGLEQSSSLSSNHNVSHRPENDGFLYYAMYCTQYSRTGTGTIVFYCAHPDPGPCHCPCEP